MSGDLKYKNADAVLDFGHDWSTWLTDSGGDTITSSTWDVPDGIIEDSNENDTTSTTVWLSGGTAGEKYSLTNEIITDGGRTERYDMDVQINI